MNLAAAAPIVLASLDVDTATDLVGIPLALALVGLLVLYDLVRVDAHLVGVPAVLTRTRNLVVAIVVVAALFTVLVVGRIAWLAG